MRIVVVEEEGTINIVDAHQWTLLRPTRGESENERDRKYRRDGEISCSPTARSMRFLR
jgi:hypothetical protein